MILLFIKVALGTRPYLGLEVTWCSCVKLSHLNQNYKVFADKFFSSAPLVLTLLWIYFGSTLCGNCLAGCQLEDDNLPRAVEDLLTPGWIESMVIVKWYDNRSVILVPSYCATEP
ncbi:hypothetical protein GOODEAATRI_018632 [Goodea atripinnis]|uniref:PiggyBac transposable element-derived protein domain-containing protein n=1 Tax=Goodea atripinnis TaxID=208336 RepID=A0ABV0P5Y2_9TELE